MGTIPSWIAWLSKINYVSWAYQGLAINEFNGIAVRAADYYPKEGPCSRDAHPNECQEGTDILGMLFNNGKPQSEDAWEELMWTRVLYLGITIAMFNVLGYFVLLAKGPKYLKMSGN